MTDPIADMLTRIRNAYLAHHAQVSLPHSQVKESIAKILHRHGYLKSVKVNSQDNRRFLQLSLRYLKGIPAITGSRRESKPGRRLYKRASQLPQVLSGRGLAIVSTSKGIISAQEARKKHLGGELLCTIW